MSLHNLPPPLTTFIGREHEIYEVRRLLQTTRLLTLTGAGGSGKTRLALVTAEKLSREYPDGVWLVELASLSDPARILQAIASTLGVREAPGRQLGETLAVYLQPKRALLLLDNCEHLIEPCARLAHRLLMTCPGLRILATSREPLHIAGEVTWLVPALFLPDLRRPPPLNELAQVEAVRLFVDRARRIDPTFTIDEQNALSIARICCWLGGLPLAIELAAARVNVLSADQIAARLDDSIRLLVSAERTAPSRHQTIQATLDWSYQLLPEKERVLFRRLAVFAGGFTLEAMEAVCADEEQQQPVETSLQQEEILDLLARLVDKSLVAVEHESGQGRRYRMLEPVRQYSGKLLEGSDEEARLRDRHLAWYLELAEQASPGIIGSRPRFWIERLEQETPNLRLALQWSCSQAGRTPQGYRLTAALTQFWQMRGYFSEGLEWLETLLSHKADVPAALRAQALQNAGFLSTHTGDIASAKRDLEMAQELWEGLGNRIGTAWQKGISGWVAQLEGDFERAWRLGEESLALHREIGDWWGNASALMLFGDLAYLHSDYSEAEAHITESLALCRQNNSVMASGRRLTRLGQISLVLGDHERARSLFAESLQLSRETGDQWGIAMALAGMAGLARAEGQLPRAASLLGVIQVSLDAFGTHLWRLDQQEFDRNISAVKSLLGEAAFEAAWQAGAGLMDGGLEGAIAFALSDPDPAAPLSRPADRGSAGETLTELREAKRKYGGLTRRERQVAAEIARGKSNPEIAAALFVGLRTVEAHVTHILNKLGFTSRTQIAGWAIDKGLARPPQIVEDEG